jgi:hypothetical protein
MCPGRPGYRGSASPRDEQRTQSTGNIRHFEFRVDRRRGLPGMIDFGDLWLVPILAVLAYLAADFLSGFVHFLADNFGSVDPLAPGSAGS